MQLSVLIFTAAALLAAFEVATPKSGEEILLEDRRGTPIPVTPFPDPTPEVTITPGPSPTPMKIAGHGPLMENESVDRNK